MSDNGAALRGYARTGSERHQWRNRAGCYYGCRRPTRNASRSDAGIRARYGLVENPQMAFPTSFTAPRFENSATGATRAMLAPSRRIGWSIRGEILTFQDAICGDGTTHPFYRQHQLGGIHAAIISVICLGGASCSTQVFARNCRRGAGYSNARVRSLSLCLAWAHSFGTMGAILMLVRPNLWYTCCGHRSGERGFNDGLRLSWEPENRRSCT